MAQHDMILDNGPGLAVRTDMNAAIQALVTLSSGATEPTITYPGQLWLDTTVGTNGILRQRNQANNGWVAPSFASGAADLFFGSKASPDRFVVNDVAAGTGVDVFTVRDDGSVVAAIPLSFIRRQVFFASTAITLHADTRAFQVELVGGGGAGGSSGASAANQGAAGGGGGGGAYCSRWITRPTGSYSPSCTVGAGGSGGAGGASGFTDGSWTLSAGGGGAGVNGSGGSNWSFDGGSAGVATGGDINSLGERGDASHEICLTAAAAANAHGGHGGSSRFGGGGKGALIVTNVATGSAGGAAGYGGGGGGGATVYAGGVFGGGAGGPGVCIITEYR